MLGVGSRGDNDADKQEADSSSREEEEPEKSLVQVTLYQRSLCLRGHGR